MVWRVGETVKFWANQPVGVPSCPFPPRPAAPPCAAAPSSARGMSGFLIRKVFEERIPLLRRNPFISELRNRRSKKSPSTIFRTRSPSSIFDLWPRRTKNPHLQSSIYGPESTNPSTFDLRHRRTGRRSDGRRGVRLLRRWGDSSKMGGFFDLPAPKNEEPFIFHLLGPKKR